MEEGGAGREEEEEGRRIYLTSVMFECLNYWTSLERRKRDEKEGGEKGWRKDGGRKN